MERTCQSSPACSPGLAAGGGRERAPPRSWSSLVSVGAEAELRSPGHRAWRNHALVVACRWRPTWTSSLLAWGTAAWPLPSPMPPSRWRWSWGCCMVVVWGESFIGLRAPGRQVPESATGLGVDLWSRAPPLPAGEVEPPVSHRGGACGQTQLWHCTAPAPEHGSVPRGRHCSGRGGVCHSLLWWPPCRARAEGGPQGQQMELRWQWEEQESGRGSMGLCSDPGCPGRDG